MTKKENVIRFEARKEVEHMVKSKYMMSVDDIAKEVSCSKSLAYKIVKQLNKELSEQGYITFAGRIPRAYWETKMYGYR